MAFNYSKPTEAEEKQIGEKKSYPLWPAGVYDAEVIRSEQTVSKSSGADMIALGIKIFNDEGKFAFVNDYLVGTDNVYSKAKIKQAAQAMALEEEWANGTLDAEMMHGRCFKVKIKQGKPQGDYPAKNEVASYEVDPAKADMYAQNRQLKQAMAAQDDLSDEIPFSVAA